MLSEKGKYASATENRRFVWKEIVWPLIIEVNDAEFTLLQYQKNVMKYVKNMEFQLMYYQED